MTMSRSADKKGKHNSSSSSSRSFDSYSDSFDSAPDEQRSSLAKASTKTKVKKMYANTNPYEKSVSKAKTKKQTKTAKKPVDIGRLDHVAQRMLSARRIRINELKNENEELKHVLEDIKTETRTLITTHKRQEKALQKYESQEGEFNIIMKRHSEEVHCLKEHIRNYRCKYENSRKQYRDVSDELQRIKSENKKLKDLVERNELQEREELDKKLTNAEIELDQKYKRIRELERHIENLKNNHRHELSFEMLRHKETKIHVDQLKVQNSSLEHQLSEKNKAMDVTNIYSNRGSKQGPISPAFNKKPTQSDSEIMATPRDKAERSKHYEQQRRERDRRRNEARQRLESKRQTDEREKNITYVDESMTNKSSWDDETTWRYRNRHPEDLKFSFQSDKSRIEQEKPDVENDDIYEMRKSAESTVFKEKFDRKESPAVQGPMRSMPPKEASPPTRSPTPELKVPTPCPSPPREPTPLPSEPTPPPSEPTPPPQAKPTQPEIDDPALTEERRKKDLLLSRLRALDEQQDAEEVVDTVIKPRYSFSKPVDNMHLGLPAHDDVKVPYLERHKRRQNQQEASASKVDKSKKKEDLMQVLFNNAQTNKLADDKETKSLTKELSDSSYQPSTGERRPARQQIINKPVVNAVDDRVHDDEIEEFIL